MLEKLWTGKFTFWCALNSFQSQTLLGKSVQLLDEYWADCTWLLLGDVCRRENKTSNQRTTHHLSRYLVQSDKKRVEYTHIYIYFFLIGVWKDNIPVESGFTLTGCVYPKPLVLCTHSWAVHGNWTLQSCCRLLEWWLASSCHHSQIYYVRNKR